jgi:Fe-S cluster assembly ATPase SufC
MCGGRIVKSGEPMELFSQIEEKGYCEYIKLCSPGVKESIEKK